MPIVTVPPNRPQQNQSAQPLSQQPSKSRPQSRAKTPSVRDTNRLSAARLSAAMRWWPLAVALWLLIVMLLVSVMIQTNRLQKQLVLQQQTQGQALAGGKALVGGLGASRVDGSGVTGGGGGGGGGGDGEETNVVDTSDMSSTQLAVAVNQLSQQLQVMATQLDGFERQFNELIVKRPQAQSDLASNTESMDIQVLEAHVVELKQLIGALAIQLEQQQDSPHSMIGLPDSTPQLPGAVSRAAPGTPFAAGDVSSDASLDTMRVLKAIDELPFERYEQRLTQILLAFEENNRGSQASANGSAPASLDTQAMQTMIRDVVEQVVSDVLQEQLATSRAGLNQTADDAESERDWAQDGLSPSSLLALDDDENLADNQTALESAFRQAYLSGRKITVGRLVDPQTGEVIRPGRELDPQLAYQQGFTSWRQWYQADLDAEVKRLERQQNAIEP